MSIEFEVKAITVQGEVMEELVWASSEAEARDAFFNTVPNEVQFSSVEVWRL